MASSDISQKPNDLKHMTSLTALSPGRTTNRASQHFLGSRSPSSIPSSPTSIHSSSSAIFERDIEPLMPPSPPHGLHHSHAHSHPPNPHRIPRAKATEHLDQSVPSVLDSAAAILSQTDAGPVSVVAPASAPALSLFDGTMGMGMGSGSGSGFASPIGSFRSRSPSPLGLRNPGGALLLSIPAGTHQGIGVSPTISLQGPPTATVEAASSVSSSPPRPPLRPTDTAVTVKQGSSGTYGDITQDPTIDQQQHKQPQNLLPSPLPSPFSSPSAVSSPLSPFSQTSHPPSPAHVATKRLSFMSYTDLRAATPAALQSLSSLTTAASAEPPPHITGVSVPGATSPHSTQHPAWNMSPHQTSGAPSLRSVHVHPAAANRDSVALLDSTSAAGGEWERQGLGRGLEERLEALASASVVQAQGAAAVV